jgi:hypothetical protein
MENVDRIQMETLDEINEIKRKREIDVKLYEIAMNHHIQLKLDKQLEEENLYRRIETLEHQLSQLLNPPPVVSKWNIPFFHFW